MRRRGHDDQFVPQPGRDAEFCLVAWPFDQTDVDLQPAHGGSDIAGVVDDDVHRSVGPRSAVASDQRWQHIVSDRRAGANAKSRDQRRGRSARASEPEPAFDLRRAVEQ